MFEKDSSFKLNGVFEFVLAKISSVIKHHNYTQFEWMKVITTSLSVAYSKLIVFI